MILAIMHNMSRWVEVIIALCSFVNFDILRYYAETKPAKCGYYAEFLYVYVYSYRLMTLTSCKVREPSDCSVIISRRITI